MFYVLFKMIDGSDCFIVKDYFTYFKNNFKQTFCMWIIILFAGIIFGFNLFFAFLNNEIVNKIALAVAIIGLLLTFIFIFYGFSLQVKYKNNLQSYFKNAVLIALGNPLCLLILLLIWVVPIYLTFNSVWFFKYLGFIWPAIGISFFSFFSLFVIDKTLSNMTMNNKIKND